MFSWVTEKALLMGKTESKAVVFRIVDEINKVHSSATMSSEWRQFVD